jgi:hypothetical protein
VCPGWTTYDAEDTIDGLGIMIGGEHRDTLVGNLTCAAYVDTVTYREYHGLNSRNYPQDTFAGLTDGCCCKKNDQCASKICSSSSNTCVGSTWPAVNGTLGNFTYHLAQTGESCAAFCAGRGEVCDEAGLRASVRRDESYTKDQEQNR